MSFKPVQPQKGYELVMHQIMERITKGELQPGDKLASVVDLAVSFGVGRSTTREALSALKAMGWLDIRQGGGTYVRPEPPKEESRAFIDLIDNADSLKEIVEVRKVLESGCASLAAKQRTDEDLVALRRILITMHEHMADEDIGEEADVQFHLQIARTTHNALLLSMMQSLTQRLQETMKDSRKLWFYGERSSAKRLYQEHAKILEAIQNQDESLASKRMLQHLMKVEKVFLSFYKGTGP